jgi:photosystem II stability/assembly factor-like uncharacterized protein
MSLISLNRTSSYIKSRNIFKKLFGANWTTLNKIKRNWFNLSTTEVNANSASSTVAVTTDGGIFYSTMVTGFTQLQFTPLKFIKNCIGVNISETGSRIITASRNGKIFIATRPQFSSYYTWAEKESDRNWQDIAFWVNPYNINPDTYPAVAVVYGGQIYISSDGGANWTARESNRNWKAVAIDGSLIVAVVENGQIYISTDTGNNWVARESNRNWIDISLASIGFNICAAIVDGGRIYVSTDSGNNWIAKESNRNWKSIAVSFDGSRMTAVAYNDRIYVSTDSGNNWIAKESNRKWTSVSMSTNGLHQSAGVEDGQIYFSTDFGDTWTESVAYGQNEAFAISGDGTKLGILDRGFGFVNLSTDLGNTWYNVLQDISLTGLEISSNGMVLVATNFNGKAYVSTDFGNTWIENQISDSNGPMALSENGRVQAFSSSNEGLFISENYGNSWTKRLGPFLASQMINGVAMSADGSIITVVTNNYVYASMNSGITWTEKQTDSKQMSDVAMSADGKYQSITSNRLLDDTDKIYVSSDYGNTWSAKAFRGSWEKIVISANGAVQVAITYPVNYVNNSSLYISTDFGNTWNKPSPSNYLEFIYYYDVAMSADGTRIFLGKQVGDLYLSSS